ncbi:MaoC family dehydratase [Nocardia fluminea]|uniref:Acyl dehydratase n=1 Tax=Nocardia fluminea TaxID=134984 RepID=A0A2N3WY04_9NOCA|nr:MaoC family dehydratase [Nocardia fluminea]PKV98735.1 acyl dehydratase [Nocardia fluminea]
MRIFHGIDELTGAVGTHLGYSDWHTITQAQIDTFADATGDHQWIHVDPAKAALGPFGSTIAHGYLTLSLVPDLVGQVYRVEGVRMGVNYGANKLRFPAPVPVDSTVRAGVELLSVKPGGGGHLVTAQVTVEREGGDKPVCVVETVSLVVV